MDDTSGTLPEKKIPFNNLFLVSGLVNGENKGWMYFFSSIFVLFGYISALLLISIPLKYLLVQNGYSETTIATNPMLLFDSKALGIDRNFVFLLELCIFVFAFAGLYVGIRFIHQKTLLSVLTAYDNFRYRRFLFAFVLWGGVVSLETLLQYFLWPGEFTLQTNIRGLLFSGLIAFLLIPIQSSFEEALFRGYLLQGLGQLFRNGIIPLLITSFLFGFAHMDNPEVKKYGWPIMLSYYSSFGLFLGLLTLLDEGLELALGIHISNNIAGSILVSPPDSVIYSYALLDSKNTNPEFEMTIWFVMAFVTFLIFWWKYRWKNFNLIIK